MDNPIDRRVATALRSYTVLVVAALVVGAVVAPFAAGLVADGNRYVAVVAVDETLTDGTATDTIRELRDLRANDSVAAVVLQVSSPGGGAAPSEAMYLAVKRLAREKPVYASVGSVAASGAYYAVLPAAAIYVEPGSIVGHVGVVGVAPSEGLDGSVTSGPDKAHRGMTREEFRASVETMKRAFVGAVMAERGDALALSRTEVAKAKAYVGARAVRNGFADEIGGLEAAIEAAATAAGLDDYAVAYRDPAHVASISLQIGPSADRAANGTAVDPDGFRGVETVQFLMLYGVPETDGVVYVAGSAEVAGRGR